MRTLYILRHAQSEHGRFAGGDLDRPLSDQGRIDALRLAAAMRAQGLRPDVVLCSKARRALETWSPIGSEFSSNCAPEITVEVRRTLYLAAPDGLLAALRGLGEGVSSAMLIGHNPGLQQAAVALAGPESDPQALGLLRLGLPSGGLAVLSFPAGRWADLDTGQGALVRFVRPADLVQAV